MLLEPEGNFSGYDDISTEETYYKFTRSRSFKSPKVNRTIKTWKVAKKRKSFKKRCTRSETGGFCMTNFCIISICVLFCYFIPPTLFSSEGDMGHLQKLTENVWRLVVFACAIVMSSVSLLFLWLTYFTDPGVIPCKKELELRMLKKGERVCATCNIIRPPRGKHCKHCDHCVKVFDHHCPYAGVCIGNGNYLFFCLLLLSTFCSSIYVATFSSWFIKEKWPLGNWGKELKVQLSVSLFLTFFSVLTCFLIGQLCGYHVLIAVTGETTNQRVLTKRAEKQSKKGSKTDDPLVEPFLGNMSSLEAKIGETACGMLEESFTPIITDTSGTDSRYLDL